MVEAASTPPQSESRQPSKELPDARTCRARGIGLRDYAECLVDDSQGCQYALRFGLGFLCKHPDWEDIARNSRPED